MIADLKPYPAYKDSGVPWLGEVPEHWEVRRLGALVRERGDTNDDNTVTEVLSVMRERGVIPYAEKERSATRNLRTSLDTRSSGRTTSSSIA